MKRKKLVIAIICVAIILLVAVAFILKNSLGISTGTCIKADNGSYMVVLDNSPVVMHPRTEKETVFANIDTGDKIFIVHDGIDETYPGQTGLYFIMKLSDGSESDVPQEILTELQELGWLKETQVSVETSQLLEHESAIYSSVIALEKEFYEMIANNPIDQSFVWDGDVGSEARIKKAVEYRDLWNTEIKHTLAILKENLTSEDYVMLETAYGVGCNDTYPLVMEAYAERTKEYAVELMALEYAFTGTVEFAAQR